MVAEMCMLVLQATIYLPQLTFTLVGDDTRLVTHLANTVVGLDSQNKMNFLCLYRWQIQD